MVDIRGLDKAAVLAALYNASRPQGMGFLQYDPEPMSVDDARKILDAGKKGSLYFDYLMGRVMKLDLSSDTEFDPRLYDRDNGLGMADNAIASLRASRDPNSVVIRAQHEVGLETAADKAEKFAATPTVVDGDVMTLGGQHMADQLLPAIDKARRGKEK